jgi:hypothetical protein
VRTFNPLDASPSWVRIPPDPPFFIMKGIEVFGFLRRDRAPEYYLVRAVIKRIRTDGNQPHELTEELRLIKARNQREASKILDWHVAQRRTSWCLYIVETARFDEALS